MEENGTGHDARMEQSHDLLVVNCNNTEESKRDAQVFQHLTCMDSRDPSFGQNDSSAVLPIKVGVADNSPLSQHVPVQLSQPQSLSTEQFHLVDQNGHPIQYELQSVGDYDTQMMIVTSPSENGQVLHVIPSTQTGMAQVIIPQGQLLDVTDPQAISEENTTDGHLQTVAVAAIADNTSSYILHPQASLSLPKKTATRIAEDPFPVPLQPLLPHTPTWAHHLRNCQKIGDSYRGYCVSETELESVLTLHKQQTKTIWGTRQSPSPAKPATRLMWKSQYVPYDGIPFVNAGSRAIVMECQFGPRRKGFQTKKTGEQESTSTCQLYKATCPARIYIKKVQKFPEYRVSTDPKIDKKIIRMEQEKAFNMLKKNLIDAGGVIRKFVERELFKPDEIPERHNLSFFPTVNDIKNHIHEVQKSLRNGETVYNTDTPPATFQWTTDSGNILTETVTVTFASPSTQGSSAGESIITKVEADQTGESLFPETAHLLSSLSSLQPKIFAQLQGLQLQPAFSSTEGTTALISVNSHSHSTSANLLDSVGSAVMNHSLLLTQGHSLQAGTCLTQNHPASSTLGSLPGSDQNLITMSQLVAVGGIEDAGSLEGSVHQIFLGDVQTIPVRIVNNHPTLTEENLQGTISVSQVKEEPSEPTLSEQENNILDINTSSMV
ncbi:calcium-responsive transcription factor isoform X2 [Macrotis lagotis]|uniref:calcium-responsive transcription factor isoform X2 n=1 Tax=Macrotis lagotis TaxID=92651 RepID=UPI003D698175